MCSCGLVCFLINLIWKLAVMFSTLLVSFYSITTFAYHFDFVKSILRNIFLVLMLDVLQFNGTRLEKGTKVVLRATRTTLNPRLNVLLGEFEYESKVWFSDTFFVVANGKVLFSKWIHSFHKEYYEIQTINIKERKTATFCLGYGIQWRNTAEKFSYISFS